MLLKTFSFNKLDFCVGHKCRDLGKCVNGLDSYSCECPATHGGCLCEHGKFI